MNTFLNFAGRILRFVLRIFHKSAWEYGTCTTDGMAGIQTRVARRHRCTGAVQFVLWKIGDKQGNYTYTEDYWHNYDDSWWPNFKSNKTPH